jgi:mannosyltransferase
VLKTLSLLLAVLSLALPPTALAGVLAGEAVPVVVTGIWLLKGAVLLLAIFLAITGRRPIGDTGVLLQPRAPDAVPGAAWVVPTLVLAGLALRLYRLGEGLWFDEIQTLVDYVRLPLGRIITTFDSQNQHLLYSIAARLAVVILGESAVALRLPAVIFGIASLWACYRFAREATTERQALIGTTILTFSFHHVWFSQNARGYTGLLLWSLLGTLAFLRLLRDPEAGWGWIWVYGLAMALAAYTHITAAFLSAAHVAILALLAWTRRGRGNQPWLRPLLGITASALLGLVLYAPVLPQFVATLLAPSPHAAETDWQSPLWLIGEMLKGLSRGLPGGWAALGIGVIVAGAGLRQFWRREPALVGLMVLPGLLTGGAMVALGHNLWPRFFFFSAGFAVLIAVQGTFALAHLLARRHGEFAATTALVVLVAGSAFTVPRAWGPKQDYVGAAAFVASHRDPSEAVVTVDLTVFPYEKYAECPCTPVSSLAELEAAEATHTRTWVLYTFPVRLAAVEPGIWQRLQTGYDTAAVYRGTVGGGDIVVMVTRSSTPTN